MSVDVYFSVDVETDGSIPGPYSILSFALVLAGRFDGNAFVRPLSYDQTFYRELRPISDQFEPEALRVNKLNRETLCRTGEIPRNAMTDAYDWVVGIAGPHTPVMVAYPLSFDWTFIYWYFMKFCLRGSPFGHSRCLDIKTAFAIKAGVPMADAGLSNVWSSLRPTRPHTHNALDDAIEQAEIFANIFEWDRAYGRFAERASRQDF